ncbi:hypothetical protein BDZ89DRAFT_1064476 [Hymenopellis radicata]|nr:hypothetical protein BDZ89DRAFT_1064476 [Hymenopellis radicata]
MLRPLPSELFLEVARHLDPADLKAARLSSKTLAAVTAPFLFRRLVVVLRSRSFLGGRDSSFQRRHSFLAALAERTTQLGKHVESLRIEEPYEVSKPPKTISNLPLRALRLLSLKKTRKHVFSEEIVKLLCRALPYLDSLYELDWASFSVGLNLPAQRLEHAYHLLKVLSTVPSIRELSITSQFNGNCLYEQYFLEFHNLTRLYYSGNFPATLVPAIISSSPKLRSLTLQHGYIREINVVDLFPVPTERHTSLERLELRKVLFTESAVSVLLPCIQQLLCLCIRDTVVPALFWHQLGHDKLWMQYLDLRRVLIDEHVLTYLSQYCGLRRLGFEITKDGMVDNAKQQVAGASIFWFGVLPHHAPVLTSLTIISRTPGDWCMDAPALDVIRECQHLRQLVLTVDWARTSRRILHLVARNTWPHLRTLGLFCVEEEVVRLMSQPEYRFTKPEDYSAHRIVEGFRFASWSTLLAELNIIVHGSEPYTFRECEDGSGEFAYHGRGDEFRREWKWEEETPNMNDPWR